MKKRVLLLITTVVGLFVSMDSWSSEPVTAGSEKSGATCKITMNCLVNRCDLKPHTYMLTRAYAQEDFYLIRSSDGKYSIEGPDPRVWEVPLNSSGSSAEIEFYASVTSTGLISIFVNEVEVARITEPETFIYKIDTSQENVVLNFWFREYTGNSKDNGK